MNHAPFFRAWYPVLEGDGTVASVILTEGVRRRAPAGGHVFFSTLMDLVGITGQLVAWGVHPFVSAYFNKREWQECWDAKLIVSDGARTFDKVAAGVGVFVEPDEETPPSTYLPVRVFADFAQRGDAQRCKAELKERADQAAWNELHYEGYSIRDVGYQQEQLIVNVSTTERSDLARVIDAAGTVVEICERHGGRTQAP